jgi:hypothetical protein
MAAVAGGRAKGLATQPMVAASPTITILVMVVFRTLVVVAAVLSIQGLLTLVATAVRAL